MKAEVKGFTDFWNLARLSSTLIIWVAVMGWVASFELAQQSEASVLFEQARAYEREQNYAAAEAVYQKVLAAHPDDPEALKRLGILEQTELKFNDSIELFKRVLREHPNYLQVNFFLGLSYYGRHDFKNAVMSFQDELKTPAPHPATRYYLALALEAVGRIEEAIIQLDQVAAQNPNKANVLYELARLHMNASFQAINRLRKLDPDSFQMHALTGELYADEGHYNAAIGEYQAALRKEPDATGIHYRLGIAYWMLRQLGTSEREFLLALRESPDNAQADLYLGDIALLQQQFSKARDYLKQAEDREPQTEQTHLLLGRCYIGLNQLQQAKAELQVAARLNPANPRSHYFLSQVYRKLGQLGDAQRELVLFSQLSSAQHGVNKNGSFGSEGTEP